MSSNADRFRVVERVVDDQVVGGLGFYKFEAVAFFTDDNLVLDSQRFDGRVLLRESRVAKLFAELERRAVECGNFVVSLDQQVGDAERVQRGQQMLYCADRAAAAGERGVVAGVGDVLQPRRDRGLVCHRGKHNSESGRRGMQDHSGFKSRMESLPCRNY